MKIIPNCSSFVTLFTIFSLSCGFLGASLAFAQMGASEGQVTVGVFDDVPVNGNVAPKAQALEDIPEIVDEKELPAPTPLSAAPAAPSPTNLSKSPAAAPLPQDSQGVVMGTNVQGDGGVVQKHSGTYYDSNALVPDSKLSGAGATGPRKVDPAYEPGGKFVVVEKGAKATSFEGQYVAATRALRLERFAASMEMFEKLYKQRPNDTRVLMGLALSQQGAGFTQSAQRSYEDLLNIQPNNADAIVNLMGIMRGQYPSVTLKKLAELRDKYPSNPGVPAQIAIINAETGEYQEALKYYDIAASLDPQNPAHIYNMAIVLDKKNDVKNAIKFYERALLMDASKGVDNVGALPRDTIYDRLVVLRRKV